MAENEITQEVIESKLEELYNLEVSKDILFQNRQQLIDAALPDEVREKLAEIERNRQLAIDAVMTDEITEKIAEINRQFDSAIDEESKSISGLLEFIKAGVVKIAKTVKSTHKQAVYTSGRVTWDTKALDGYAAAHPEIQPFRKVGEPSVAIRGVTQK